MRDMKSKSAMFLAAAGVVAAGTAAAVKFMPAAPTIADTLARSHERFLDVSATLGMKLDALTVEGRGMTPREDLLAALDVERGAPILSIDVGNARAAIEALPWVKSAKVERRLPGSIHVLLEERVPYALWQRGDRYTLVDHVGNAIVDVPAADQSLPLIVGPDAPEHAAALFEVLRSEAVLAGRVRAAVRVGARRWNIYLDDFAGGIAIRLPEDGVAAAWTRLAALEREHKILERNLEFIDLRLEDRLVVRIHKGTVPADAAEAAAASAPNRKAPAAHPVIGKGPKQDI